MPGRWHRHFRRRDLESSRDKRDGLGRAPNETISLSEPADVSGQRRTNLYRQGDPSRRSRASTTRRTVMFRDRKTRGLSTRSSRSHRGVPASAPEGSVNKRVPVLFRSRRGFCSGLSQLDAWPQGRLLPCRRVDGAGLQSAKARAWVASVPEWVPGSSNRSPRCNLAMTVAATSGKPKRNDL
jgi:hypothetical protein